MTQRSTVTALVPALAGGVLTLLLLILAPALPAAADAESTGFQPAQVELPGTGSTATVTVVATGIPSGTSGVQFLLSHPSSISVTEPKCTGLFNGATPLGPVAAGEGVVVACIFLDPNRSISTPQGELMTLTLTRFGPGDGEVRFVSTDAFKTEYIAGGVSQGPGRLEPLRVSGSGVPGSPVAGGNPPAQATSAPPAATQPPAATPSPAPTPAAGTAAATTAPAATPEPGTATAAPSPDATATAEATPAETATAAATETATVAATTGPGAGTTATTQAPAPISVSDGAGDDEGSSSPAVIFIVVAVVVAAGGAIAYYFRRKRGNPPVV